MYLLDFSVVFLVVLIRILSVLIVLSVRTVLYIFSTRIPVSASEPRRSIISVHFICLLIDFRIFTRVKCSAGRPFHTRTTRSVKNYLRASMCCGNSLYM